jgi:diphosphomevalonate decarboxylase
MDKTAKTAAAVTVYQGNHMSQIIGARAPSNIAIVKFMGKRDDTLNIPENPSLSLTLNKLCSYVEITCSDASDPVVPNGEAAWVAEPPLLWGGYAGLKLQVPRLEEEGIDRFLRHFERVRRAAPEILLKYSLPVAAHNGSGKACSYLIRSGNTFPMSAGIASSAASFAALTLATAMTCAGDQVAFDRAWKSTVGLPRDLANLSRQGSGSSCRSFEGPWVGWDREHAFKVYASTPKLAHFVLLVSGAEKEISSSIAHQLVKESPLWMGRVERASTRFGQARMALAEGDLACLAKIAWREAWEMHSLFHTAAEPFSYWHPCTIEILQWLSALVHGPEPPVVSMDAGPNVHLIVTAAKAEFWRGLLVERYGRDSFLEDEPGSGTVPMRQE